MRDPRVEQVLNTTADLAWEYLPTIPLSKIDRSKSESNQARIDKAIDPELVRQYKTDMVNGDTFPAGVYFVDGDAYVTSDGNHRTAAARDAGKQTVDGYAVVADDPTVRQALTFEWNVVLNGKQASDDDRDRHAAFLVAQGFTQKEVANRLHMSPKRVEEIVAEDAGHTRAMSLGLKSPWAKIPARYSRVRLHNDLKLDSVFTAAVKYVGKFQLTGKEVRELTAEINSLRSEHEQLGIITKKVKVAIAEMERAKATKRKGGPGQSPKNMYVMHLRYVIQKYDEQFQKLILPGLNDEEKAALKDEIKSARLRMSEAISLLDGS